MDKKRKIIYTPSKNKIDTEIKRRNLAFFDLEFSGLNFDNEIIEMGCILVRNSDLQAIEEFFTKVKPQNISLADKDSLKMVGYSEEKWKDALSLKEALEKFDSVVKDAVLVGYNPVWDLSFLIKSYWKENIKVSFHWQVLDVMSMAYEKLYGKDIKGFRMSEVAEFLGIKNKVWHNALEDARLTYEIFKKLKNL